MIRVRHVKINVRDDNRESLINAISRKIGVKDTDIIDYVIVKRSLDARYKPDLFYIYEVDVNVLNVEYVLRANKKNKDVCENDDDKYIFPKCGCEKLNHRPVIVGSGPAGLFCGYLLSLMGYKPLILERGERIEDRVKTVEDFWNNGILNKESNVQFGEGGAGTFSDGKLNTLTKDKFNRIRFVFEKFIECGANKDILISNSPNIGSDVLRDVVINLRKKIISMGGEILYNSCLTNINVCDNKVKSIVINNDLVIDTDLLVLAIGHSARDTFKMLYDLGVNMEAKPFAMGIRIQHPQEIININQYGEGYYKGLPQASYKLTYKALNGRGVYSFCMCPGGYVVNASSEDCRLAINGMSYYKRDSKNANSAIVVTVTPDDFGNNPMDGIKYQRDLEERAYKLGNGYIPVQLFKDYLNNCESNKFGSVEPVFKGRYNFANLNKLYPEYINESLKDAIKYFDRKIKGFSNGDSIIAGIESRTSSPVRIVRNEMFVSNIEGIYPCGEGAGYAGGITTSSVDGIKVAEAIINKYNKIDC